MRQNRKQKKTRQKREKDKNYFNRQLPVRQSNMPRSNKEEYPPTCEIEQQMKFAAPSVIENY